MIVERDVMCYTLYCLADPAAEGLTDFHVYHKQEHRYGKTHVSYVKEVYVDVYGHKIELRKGNVVIVSMSPMYDILFGNATISFNLNVICKLN